jgi:hypothetical protein
MYVTWAGITAGKANSFFSFTGGGDNWANFFSPDQRGFNQPALLAYTASFGGGFSASIAAQSQGSYNGTLVAPNSGATGGSGGGTNMAGSELTFGGQRWPDLVAQLHVTQGWGEAQLSGVLHNVNVSSTTDAGYADCGLTAAEACNYKENKVGWGIDAGVKFNLPSFGAGDNFVLTGAFTQNAAWYSGLPDGMWGENGQTNGNGQSMYIADAYFNPLTNTWSKPTAWSVSALFEHHFTPAFYVDLEGSVGGIDWNNQNGTYCYTTTSCYGTGQISPHAFSWIIGADLGWNPVTNLNFDLELMYQSTTQDKPSGFLGTVYGYGTSSVYYVPGAWQGNSSGFAGRLRITRYF